MNILCLSDLHMEPDCARGQFNCHTGQRISLLLERYPETDVVVIAGDIVESKNRYTCYSLLDELFPGKLVVFVLGNHEFLHCSVERTLKDYAEAADQWPMQCCLNVSGPLHYNGVLFAGSTLWFDGSMGNPGQDIQEWRDGQYAWVDRTIVGFDSTDYIRSLCRREQDEINRQLRERKPADHTVVMVTHHVPHHEINRHPAGGHFNIYSGVYDYLNHAAGDIDYAICGHTHWRDIGRMIGRTCCINPGNNYHGQLEHHYLEVGGDD